ncbi:efflux RND transporter periplasmic adaptor subunit [Rhizobium sp. ARZ01]|uniref:efflux RND transporter periplasmic adaptor subunit n=1 Tax=Rhizobium sp. ARZ01 TaxID=2769313 RepID=UPI0017851B37|nr:efflux RND transporter periplasmic adaptor subunit [Rhizobium sp. ARZ01]MBD9373347.1 efflux RND transporter periplasmic adaptor subunit [Rhizobium sp. ARZ01]
MARGLKYVLCLSVAATAAAYAGGLHAADAAPSQPGNEQTENLPAIVVTAAEERTIVDRVIATGTIQPVEEVYVAPLVDGLSIRSLGAEVADRVKEGDTLATLNDDALILQKSQLEAMRAKAEASLAQIEAQLIEAKANAEEADKARERAEKLVKSGATSQAIFDQATAAAKAAVSRVTSAEQAISVSKAEIKVMDAQIADIDLKLARTAVKAPVSGIISSRTAKIGAIAMGASQPLFSIIRDGEIELKADVSESSILKLAVGQKATVTLAGGAAKLSGRIRLVEPTLSNDTRLGHVYIKLDEPEKARVGMFASAEIIAQETKGIVLPLSAITTSRDGTVARKVEDGIVKLVKVETGIQDGQVIEIASGLKAGDEVVAKAGAYVRDGDRVRPVKATSPVAAN